ncbi:MAG: SdpI family protein [Ruminococcus sp.]|nr:SdpI family protein [Ruminococcus sp.]
MEILIIVSIILSFAILFAGFYMKYQAPKDEQMKMGLRTERAKASQETWAYANRNCGRYCLIFGGIGLALSIISLLVYAFAGDDWGRILAVITPAVICVGTSSAVNVVNNGLCSKFDENGRLKEMK